MYSKYGSAKSYLNFSPYLQLQGFQYLRIKTYVAVLGFHQIVLHHKPKVSVNLQAPDLQQTLPSIHLMGKVSLNFNLHF